MKQEEKKPNTLLEMGMNHISTMDFATSSRMGLLYKGFSNKFHAYCEKLKKERPNLVVTT